LLGGWDTTVGCGDWGPASRDSINWQETNPQSPNQTPQPNPQTEENQNQWFCSVTLDNVFWQTDYPKTKIKKSQTPKTKSP